MKPVIPTYTFNNDIDCHGDLVSEGIYRQNRFPS